MVINTTNNRLLKSEIIRKKKEFDVIFTSSKIVSSPSFTLRYLESPRRKVGFIISHSVSSRAVIRNRIKRYLREIYRTNKEYFKDNYSYLFQARTAAANKNLNELKEEILFLAKKTNNGTK
jgi:ribonuclease P protein component